MTEKNISAHSLLVTLSISTWDANRQDRRASDEAALANNVTNKRMCRLRKSLLPKSRAMDMLTAAVRAARSFHYENTHAWMHDGPRILSRANYEPYMTQMRTFKAKFDVAVLNVLADYESLKDRAKGDLGQLYNSADYPPRESLFTEYRFSTAIQPLPLATSLLDLGLETAEAEQLRLKMEGDLAATFEKANRRLWEDLYARLEKLYAKLADEKAYVMEETIDAVRKLAELLPRMNITQDANLEVLATTLTNSLAGLSATDVKHNPAAREKATSETGKVFHIMQSLKSRQHSLERSPG